VISIELRCRNCSWRSICGRDEAIARLRSIGRLRRNPDADDALIATLMTDSAGRMACPACDATGLIAQVADPGWGGDESEWQAAVLCEICRKPVPPERLAALPQTKRCVACQEIAEAGREAEQSDEYCPQCGALVELRVSRGAGITRYKRFCTGIPPCRL
jgi:hypothetical protein